MPLEELLKMYNYGAALAAETGEADAADSGKKVGPQPERLRDVRPDKNRQEKNGVAAAAAAAAAGKNKAAEVRHI